MLEILTQKGAILRIKRASAILKWLVNILLWIGHTYHDTNQIDKAREQKLRWEAAIIGEVKRKYECELWEGGDIFEHYKY